MNTMKTVARSPANKRTATPDTMRNTLSTLHLEGSSVGKMRSRSLSDNVGERMLDISLLDTKCMTFYTENILLISRNVF